MSVTNLDEKRETFSKQDRVLLENLIEMHADMCTALDLTKGVCPEESPEKNSLMQYEQTLAAGIKRLKDLSPYLK